MNDQRIFKNKQTKEIQKNIVVKKSKQNKNLREMQVTKVLCMA